MVNFDLGTSEVKANTTSFDSTLDLLRNFIKAS